jgi:hypothetical protein
MGCGCGQRTPNAVRAPGRLMPAGASGVDAGSYKEYEVITARGTSTGRRFTSLVAASGYAARIGGTTRPV